MSESRPRISSMHPYPSHNGTKACKKSSVHGNKLCTLLDRFLEMQGNLTLVRAACCSTPSSKTFALAHLKFRSENPLRRSSNAAESHRLSLFSNIPFLLTINGFCSNGSLRTAAI